MASIQTEVDTPGIACLYLMKRGYFVRLRGNGSSFECQIHDDSSGVFFVGTGATRLDAIRSVVEAAAIEPEPAILDAS